MAFQTFAPPQKPHVASPYAKDVRALTSEFGDRASQRMPDGINPIAQIRTLRWPGSSNANTNYVDGFFDEHGIWGTFWYRVPGMAEAKRWRFTSFEAPGVNGETDDLSVGIEESFEIEE
jgi:phage-related protein